MAKKAEKKKKPEPKFKAKAAAVKPVPPFMQKAEKKAKSSKRPRNKGRG